MTAVPLTAIEVEEGWVSQPCGCAYHPGDNTPVYLGGGVTQTSSGFRARWCDEHTAEMMRAREEMRYRLFEAPDQPAPSRFERWKASLGKS